MNSISKVFPLVEAFTFESGTIDKTLILKKVNESLNENFDLDTLEVVFDGLQEKFDSEFYGIEFLNRPTHVGFFAKDIKNII